MKINKLRKAAMTIEFVIVVSILVLIGCLGTSYVFANYDTLVGKANKVEDSIIVKGDGTVVGGGSQNGGTEIPDGGEAVQLAAGFYLTDGTFYSWDVLVAENYITVNNGVLNHEINGKLYNIGSGTFIISENVTTIPDYAFEMHNNIVNVVIPNSVTVAGEDVFGLCDTTIFCEANEQPTNWKSSWNYSNDPVYWAGEWSYVDGVPTPNSPGNQETPTLPDTNENLATLRIFGYHPSVDAYMIVKDFSVQENASILEIINTGLVPEMTVDGEGYVMYNSLPLYHSDKTTLVHNEDCVSIYTELFLSNEQNFTRVNVVDVLDVVNYQGVVYSVNGIPSEYNWQLALQTNLLSSDWTIDDDGYVCYQGSYISYSSNELSKVNCIDCVANYTTYYLNV